MTTKRKVPMTKAGKPDKRYVKSVNAKSKVTGKAPSKRTKSRRAKPQLKGYSANPVKRYYTVFAVKNGDIIAYWDGATFDTDRYKQKLYSDIGDAKKDAEKIAEKIKSGYRVGYGREPDPIKKR